MIWFYNKAKAYFTGIIRIKKQLKYAEKFLKRGRFIRNNSKTVWARKAEYLQSENRYIFKEKIQMTRIASKFDPYFFFREYRVSRDDRDNKLFYGDALLLSRIYGEGKVIDYKNEQILSYFETKERMDSILNKRQKWKSIGYNTVQLINTGYNYYIESYKVKHSFDAKEALDFIMKDILFHQSKTDDLIIYNVPDETATRMRKVFGNDTVCGEFECFIDSNGYIKRICHGDLYRYNLIFDGNKFYYIDFEMIEQHVFFFDIIYFIWFEYYRFNNECFLKKYFDGEYDFYFAELFHVNGCDFKKDNKTLYYYLVLYEYFCEVFHAEIPSKLLNYPKR